MLFCSQIQKGGFMSKKKPCYGQLSIPFDGTDLSGMLFSLTTREEGVESLQEYLRRGERLVSLAKEHLQKTVSRKMPDVETAVYDMPLDITNYSPRECLIKLRNIVGGYLRAIKEEGDDSYKSLCSLTGGRVSIKIREDLSSLKHLLGGEDDDVIIEVNVVKEGGEPHKFFCLKNKPMGLTKKSHVVLYQQTLLTEDVRNVLGYIILYNEIEKAFKDDTLSTILLNEVRRNYYDRASVIRIISGMLSENAWNVLVDAFKCGDRQYGIFLPMLRREIQQYLESGHVLKVAMAEKAIISETLAKNLERYGMSICIWPEDEKPLIEKAALQLMECYGDSVPDLEKEIQAVIGQMVIPLPDQLRDTYYGFIFWADSVLVGALPGFNDTFYKMSRFSGNGIIKEHFRDCSGKPGAWYWDNWLFKLFYVIYVHRHEALAQWREYKESESEYAKSYMNKAGLPQKTVQAMQTSLLNDFFGFVEYDEDVDLVKAAEVEKMFLAVKETYLKGFDASRNAIRFRKLGNHNATGLYYPGVKCLCVDYRHPSSFMHEFGHLIDYECGSLSLEGEFYQIKRLYKDWLAKYEDSFNKKSKYNIQYYLKPTEIFARSFEIFCHEVLKIENDLLPDKFAEAVYPNDEQYIREVTAYFNSLLERKVA